MCRSNRASASPSSPRPLEQDIRVPANAAGHQIRALHRRALAGAHHAGGAARLPRPQVNLRIPISIDI